MKDTIKLSGDNSIMFLSALLEIKKDGERSVCFLSDRVVVTTGHWALSIPIDNKKETIFGWVEVYKNKYTTDAIRALLKSGKIFISLNDDDKGIRFGDHNGAVGVGYTVSNTLDKKTFTERMFKCVACFGSDTVTLGTKREFNIEMLSTYEKIFKKIATVKYRKRAIVSLWSDADGDRIFVKGEHTHVDGSIPSFVFMPVAD